MILFNEDWEKYPTAIPQLSSKNTTWIRTAGVLKAMGIENHLFLLALHDPALEGVDPFDENISSENIIRVVNECNVNPWYFFREVVRIIPKGTSAPSFFKARRSNISAWWLYFNHVTIFLHQPRQTGKSWTGIELFTYLFLLKNTYSDFFLLTRNNDLRVKTLNDIKDSFSWLPFYIKDIFKKSDTFNTEKVHSSNMKNTIYSGVGQNSESEALKTGRGLSIVHTWIDEYAFIDNNESAFSSLLAAGTTARDNAKLNGNPYGIMFSSTAGYLSTKSGSYAYKLYKDCLRWDERLFDSQDNKDLVDKITKNNPSGKNTVLLEYSHRQLGFTDTWMDQKIKESLLDQERAEAEFLNIWSTGSETNPIPKDLLKIINESRKTDYISRIYKHNFLIRWYINDYEIDNLVSKPFLIGLDTSDAVGNDDIALCCKDIETGGVIGIGIYNETNLTTFSDFVADLLLRFPQAILIPERRSSGVYLIDYLLEILINNGMNPFKRIFNWVVNEALYKKEYQEILMKPVDMTTVNVYRKQFGYATSGGGKSSRDNLYGLAFNSCIQHTAHLMHDTTLIYELNNLVKKNERIDHKPGEHDDVVISLLLGHWFLLQARNLKFYGVEPSKALSLTHNLTEEEKLDSEEIKKQENTIRKINHLIMSLKGETNIVVKTNKINQIKILHTQLSDKNKSAYNLESLLANINMKKTISNNTLLNRWPGSFI